MARLRFMAVLFAVASQLVSACNRPEPPVPRPEASEPIKQIELARHGNSVSALAMMSGRLEREDGCLFIRDLDGALVGLAWPADAKWVATSDSVVVDENEARVGANIQVGGGIYDVSAANLHQYFWMRAPDVRCLGECFWFVGAILPSQPDAQSGN